MRILLAAIVLKIGKTCFPDFQLELMVDTTILNKSEKKKLL